MGNGELETGDSSLEDGENSTQKTPRLVALASKKSTVHWKEIKHRLSMKQSDPNPPVVN